MTGEINPNHPVTQRMREQWHKICALLMADQGIEAFEITTEMLDEFRRVYGDEAAVVADTRGERFVVRLVHGDEARRLARQEGGLPA